MLVPGRYGMKNAKWVVALRAMNREFVDWYGQRGWSRTAVVKTMSRIDVPAPGATLAPGEHRIAGIAYAGDRGVASVEFSADGGGHLGGGSCWSSRPAGDVWVRWQGTFLVQPEQETITLVARATDGTGRRSRSRSASPSRTGAPAGARSTSRSLGVAPRPAGGAAGAGGAATPRRRRSPGRAAGGHERAVRADGGGPQRASRRRSRRPTARCRR